jgi:hypothetical protein
MYFIIIICTLVLQSFHNKTNPCLIIAKLQNVFIKICVNEDKKKSKKIFTDFFLKKGLKIFRRINLLNTLHDLIVKHENAKRS